MNTIELSNSLELDQANVLSGMIWVQTVCNVYQQTTLEGKGLIDIIQCICLYSIYHIFIYCLPAFSGTNLLYTREFFHLDRYNEPGIVHCTYQGVTGYNCQINP